MTGSFSVKITGRGIVTKAEEPIEVRELLANWWIHAKKGEKLTITCELPV